MARRPSSEDSAEGFGWKNFLSHLTGFGILLACCAVLVAATFGLRPLERRSAALSPAKVTRVEVVWPQIFDEHGDPIGTWLPVADQESILRMIDATVGTTPDPFSREPLEKLGAVLTASGWFDGTPRISREAGATLKIDGHWRTPAAVVRHDNRDYLVDHLGRQLPPIYAPGDSTLKYMAEPVMPPPMGKDGARDFITAWAGEDIIAGLELLALIGDQPWSDQVAGVDVSAFSVTGMLEIVTSTGTRVVWGGRPSKPLIGDVSTAQKLANIAALYRRYGRVDGSYARAHIYRAHVVFDTSASAESATAQVP